ncbi:copper chaperone PCu(A)C [Neptunomonas antarctica]|uniref:Copper(I)-binding protein n=1 Tax=Neptunomonas antarctica TaxID=619304 RepID=A0A1N7KDY5_9GAMM|nr:copper chaperone PCu(A)C [Neptunomonas antarctica]SIS59815.1 hypothetical protein SAMN05421760_102366 [Neptunomonas antarctica]
MKKILLTTILLAASHFTYADVIIESAYVRAVPPGQMNSAAFMQLKNKGEHEITLTKASSDVAKNVELHTHINDNGIMRMRKINDIKVPAGKIISLQPGGMHIMLIGLTRNLNIGDNIGLSLEFSDGTQQSLEIPVKDIMSMGNTHHMMHTPETKAE